MQQFIFDLQRFATQTISAGGTYPLDGVTYTAVDGDAVLNLDDDGKVSGIASGKVQAVVTGATDSPIITFDATQAAVPTALTAEDGSLALNLGGRVLKFAEGTATITSDKITTGTATFSISGTYSNADYKFMVEDSSEFSITADSFRITSEKLSVDVVRGGRTLNFGISGTAIRNFTDHTFALAGGTSISTTLGDYTFNAKVPDGASVGFNLTESGIIFTPGENDGGLALSIKSGDGTVFGGNLAVSGGSIGFNPATQTLSFTKGTKTVFTLGNYTFEFTATDDISSKFAVDTDGNLTITPGENDGSLDITIKRDDTPIFSNNVSVVGKISFNTTTQSLGLADGTKISTTFGDYEVTATADGDAAVSVAMTSAGLSITPNTGDGTLNLQLGSANGSMSANLEVLSGSFILGENGGLTVAKDTELQIDFGGDYVVKFKTTDDAGGKISLGAGGLTFSPTEGDGHLELSVTRGGETRTTSLEMTGSLTYKLDGSISLAKGTVVKNIFEDGNILTITANTDASGSMIFDPNSGLYITPSTPDALNVVLTTDGLDVVNISSITGTINYTGGVVTASDGTKAHISYYFGWESELRTTGGTASIQFTADRTVYTANEGSTFLIDYLDGTTSEIQNGTYSDIYATETEDAIELISAGSTFKCNDEEVIFTLESAGSYTLNGIAVTTTAANTQVQLTNYDTVIVDGISYTPLDDNVTLTIDGDVATVAGGKVSLQMDGFDTVSAFDVTSGSIAYDGSSDKFTIAQGTKTYLGSGNFPDQFVAQSDFDITVTKNSDGTFTFTSDDSAAFAIERTGNAIMSTTLTLDGSIIVDPTNNQISVPKDTVLTMTPGDDNKLEITALADAGGELTLASGGIRFAPNSNDGALEFNFVNSERKVQLDVTGAFTYKGLGALSLEDGTEATFTWEDGNKLQLTSSGSTGSIGLDPTKGLKITSDDENLDLVFTSAAMGYTTEVSAIKGSLWYKAGVVTLEEGTKLTGTGSISGQAVDVTLEAVDGDGYLIFGTTGLTYGAGTGKLQVTLARDGLASTFIVNEGSVIIDNGIFNIAEGTDLETDLQDFIPALNFKTSEAGTYTINGQKIKTSAEGLALTATDDQMVFHTSDDAVTYDGMTFTGDGNVTLTAENVTLGNGVIANGFGEGNSFVLTEAGTVTADEKIFELTESYLTRGGESVLIPLEITVTGAEDGFIFSRTTTEESEEAIGADPPEVGKVFTEKFISHGDSSYRTRTDAIGLEEVIGISDGATITGGASLADEPTLSYYNLVTDTTGKFTIGERTYNVSGDSSIVLRARFEVDNAPYASMVDSLNGTISGDFSGGNFSINGSSAMQVYGDTDVSIVADDSGFEIRGLDAGAKLLVSAAGTYNVNGTEITADAPAFIVGTEDGTAQLYNLPTTLADFMLHKTAAGYPQMAAVAFHPDEANPDAPTNYYLAEQWTTTSTDDLQLSAIHYSPENPTGKWVILVHGYGKKGAAMNASAEPYLEQGMDVLIIDQRAAGDSAGDWLTMGVAEANDLAIWTQEIAKTNANAQITLHGVSMGAATVMLAAALPETANLSAMIEDCGYGNIADVFKALMYAYGSALGVSGVDLDELFDDVDAVAKVLNGGYDIADAAPIESIGAVTVPSLFIHGSADVAIPSTNADALYEASGASNKTKLIIEGAGHAKSIEIDSDAYFTAVTNLIDSSTTEIGALINSDENAKLLRGTIYNDTIENSGTAVTIEALGGDDYVINNVDSTVTAAEFGNLIELGDGNDTVYNHHSYNPTLLGGAGDDSIVISRGHKTFADGGEGNDSIIGRFADNPDSDWAIGGHATVLGGDGDDYISTGYTNDSTINGGAGDDTIITCGLNNTIDGGDGNNLISMTVVDREDLSEGSFIVLNGNTTVEGFNTGFGEGTDTVYITGESPAVDFKDDGLTLYYDDDSTKSLTFAGLSTTDKLNLYYEANLKSVAEVFIADDEWYSVTADDLSVMDNNELRFVGATAKMNHGIDFSGITSDVNATLLGHNYPDYVENLWINNIHSIKGGAGLTTITGSDKDDTIIAGTGSTTIDGGDGNNLVDLTDSSAAQIVLNGNTTVEGFHTGFGEGSDTIYIDGDPAGVEFKDGVLAFGNSTDSLTLSDVTTTSKVNIYHKRRDALNKGVFIAAGDWYKVEDSDLTVDAGEEVYFVGTSADPKAGVDFSGISAALNVTMDTAYIDSEDYVPGTTTWINGVYSLKGGAGLTTVTGSKQSDTIIAGTGATTINAAGGDDVISLGSASALVEYNSSDGNDLIQGFNENSTLSISGEKYSSKKSGDDLIVTVGEDKLTLEGAADLTANIIGEQYSTEDELSDLTNGYLTSSPNYGEPVTVQSEVDTLLASGDLNGNMALLLEDQSADFRKFTGKKSVTLAGSSDQDISFNNEGGNRAIVGEDANGTKNISLGGGGDVVLVSDTDAKVNIDASAGNDVIISKDSKVSVNLNGGKTDLFVTGGRMTLEGYDASTKSGFGTSYESILEAINNGGIYFDNGKLSLDSAVIDFNDLTSRVLNFFDLAGNLQKVGLTSPNDSLDLSKETANFILVPNKNSTLIGGSGDDTIFAFEGSRIDAGAGKNSIFLEERAANAEGVTIVLDSSGRNTIENFTAGFDDTSDVLFFGTNDTVDFKFDGTNLTVTNNDNSRCGFLTSIASDAPFVEISAADDNAPVKIVVAQKDAVITVDDELADLYSGDKSCVDFTNYDGNLMANLGSAGGSIGAGEVLFSGINKITAGSGHNTIIGSDVNETLIAGKSDNSIYGGGGLNLLQGYTGDDKVSHATFFALGQNDGAVSIIEKFEFVEPGNYINAADVTADAIDTDIANNRFSNVAITEDGGILLEVTNNSTGAVEKLLVTDAITDAGYSKDFVVNGIVAQVGDNLVNVDKFVNFYLANGANATAQVDSSVDGELSIWLSDSLEDRGKQFEGDFTVIDATKSNAVKSELAGNDNDNTIYAGNSGATSLWGGNGGNDLLVGGEGVDSFFYGLGNGNDTISGISAGDNVILAGITLDQISDRNITENAVVLNFTDGGSLRVEGNSDVTYQLADGSKFSANHETMSWNSK